MKENKYDDDRFFQAYSQFPRSVQGLSAAGEWHALRAMLPDFEGKRVLDVGCGFGWHCVYAAANGAAHVMGVDISEKMLAVAREKTDAPNVEYQRVAMEDMAYAPGSFDIVISSLAFHYTPDFGGICRRIYDYLTPGGDFVFSCEHPVFTAQGTQDWLYGENGERVCWPVDRYFIEGRRETVFLGERVVKFHRTVTMYLNALWQAGFSVTGFVEPEPPQTMLDESADMRDELRRPMMMIIAAQKP